MLDTFLDIKEKDIITRELDKEDLDKVRDIEGFPIGNDKDIIDLSRPPYYTACPNPFIEEFVKNHSHSYNENDDYYNVLPYTRDVEEGKTDELYNIHTYHTKVPPKAILKYILHYTKPGDMIYDAFCGSGMTGVATNMASKGNEEILTGEFGERYCILSDISTAAAFIAHNYNNNIDTRIAVGMANNILEMLERELGWMYKTQHYINNNLDNIQYGRINYVVWSDLIICPNCGNEICYYDAGIDEKTGLKKSSKELECDKCKCIDKIGNFKKSIILKYDEIIKEKVKVIKQVPVLINYTFGNKKYNKAPDKYDLDLLNRIDEYIIKGYVPIERLPIGHNTRQPIISHNINYVHQFYDKRSLICVSYIYDQIDKVDIEYKNILRFWVESVGIGFTKMNRYFSSSFSQVNRYLKGTLYIAPVRSEVSPWYCLNGKIKKLNKLLNNRKCIVTTQSSTKSNIPDNSIDYIFIDPPFGSNLMYSELNFIWESWLRVKTNNQSEAIINTVQNKNENYYRELMNEVLKDLYRVLKPGRWITVEFHNSQNSVWNILQNSILYAGFEIADIRLLDKKQKTMKQFSTDNAVDKDLIITAFKPKESFVNRVLNTGGGQETAWSYTISRLEKLPIVIEGARGLESVKERDAKILYDRMISYHILNELAIPIDAKEYYNGLEEKFINRDGMYFLSDQVNKYDNIKLKSKIEIVQYSLLISKEKDAISWLYKELQIPQEYGELQPKFMKELKISRYEKIPELLELLEENFLKDDYGKWYIPDITKSGDLIKLREKRLVKEFEEYLKGKGKLKVFRTEAVRAGFAKLWNEKDYKYIVKVAERLPESVIQEDDKLLMYYDISLSRIE